MSRPPRFAASEALEGLETAWTQDGGYTGVAAHGEVIYAVAVAGRVSRCILRAKRRGHFNSKAAPNF
jgi:hypothetical protein